MNRFLIACKLQSAAFLAPLLLSNPLAATQIDSVCKTDDQTLNSIKSDSDQTLWIFMQTVCKGEFIVTTAPASPQSYSPSPPLAEVTVPTPQAAITPVMKVDQKGYAQLSGGSKITIDGEDHAVTQSAEKEGFEQSTIKIFAQPFGAIDSYPSPTENDHNIGSQSFEVVIQAAPDISSSIQGRPLISANVEGEIQVIEDQVPKDEGSDSNRARLYSLLDPSVSHTEAEPLPPPIEYESSRFSNYKPNYLGDLTASNHGKGYLQKPDVMSITPHGFFASLYWHSYDEPNVMKQAGPSLGVGYVDERAVREWESYPGLGSRFEVGQGWVKYEGSGEITNRTYYGLAEVYAPISHGFFVGLGLRRYVDDKVPEDLPYGWGVRSSTGARAYDRISDYLYLPLGFAGVGANGSTYKVQLNYLIEGRQTSKLTQTYIADDLRNIQKDGWGLDISYSPNLKSEVFLRLWDVKKSDVRGLTVGGLQTGYFGYEPANTTVELGVRGFW